MYEVTRTYKVYSIDGLPGKMRGLGVEEDAIVMGIKAVLHGDDFEDAEPDENQAWQ